jgi:CDP-paratose 2-epimerase
MTTILITGGAGFIGSNISLFLKRKFPFGKVVALDNLKRRGSELNLGRLHRAGVEFVHGDIRIPEDLRAAGKFDLMIECSAEPSVTAGYDDSPAYLLQSNLMGTINCLDVVRNNKAGIIFLSTSRVYPIKTLVEVPLKVDSNRFDLNLDVPIFGLTENGISEEFNLLGNRSLYGATKLSSELIIQEYADIYNIPSVINRCGVVTGPWQMGKVDQGVAVLWLAKHYFGGKLNYVGYGGRGHQVRDFLSIIDLEKLVGLQVDSFGEYFGEVFNIGGGASNSFSLAQLTDLCRSITGNAIEIEGVELGRAADIPWYVTDCSKANKAFKWEATQSINKTLHDILDWIKANELDLRPLLA